MSRRVLILGFLLASLVAAIAAPPAWWASRGATDANPPNDDAAVNQGQLKHFTQKAVQELNARIPGGAGEDLNELVNGWVQAYQTGGYSANNPLPADFEAMNAGQLKWIANQVHARLVFAKYENAPPAWLVPNAATDEQLVNLGQLKTVFNFDLTAPTGQLPEWWQRYYFSGQTGIDPNQDSDEDDASNLAEFLNGTNPFDPDTDDDFMPDGWEIQNNGRAVIRSAGTVTATSAAPPEGATPSQAATVQLNPLDPADATLDPDEDGLTNLQEYLNGTRPDLDDTDGDGASDGAEVNSGANPNDGSDGGVPGGQGSGTVVVEIPFAIGGDYAWWEMTIKGQGPTDTRTQKITSSKDAEEGQGQYEGETQMIKLHARNKYRVTIKRMGGVEENDGTKWYCWSANVGTEPGSDELLPLEATFEDVGFFEPGERLEDVAVAYAVNCEDGDGKKATWVIDNRDGLFTQHIDDYGNDVVQQLEAFLLPVEFKQLWETKNKANQVFNATKKDDPITMPSPAPDAAGSVHGVDTNHLYVVVDPTDNKLGVTLDLIVGGDPTKWVAAAFNGGSKVSGSDTVFPASGPVEMRIPQGDELAIRVGYDANANSLLDSSEEVKLTMSSKFDKSANGEPTVKGISSSKYSAMSTTASGVIALGYTIPHSAEFLRLFRDGATTGMPADKRPSTTTSFTMDVFKGELSEWITHNAGAAFSDGGVADISFHHWDATTSAAEMAGLSYTVETAVHHHFDTAIMPQVTAHFASLPPGALADFPQGGLATISHTHDSTPSWVPRTTVLFDSPFLPNPGGDDAFGVIGRGRVPMHQAKYTVKKVEYDQYLGDDPTGGPIFRRTIGYDVTARTVGSVGDLYDFNCNAGGVNEIGATLQLGYGKGTYGRTAGQIYRWDISWDETIDWFKQ